MAKQTLRSLYDERYIGSAKYRAKGGAQEAHECIRPTDTQVSPNAVRQALGDKGERAADLYELIYRCFLASQMAPAVYDEVHVAVVGGDAVFSAKGSRLAFDGFLRMYNYVQEQEPTEDGESEEEGSTNKELPPLRVDEAVKALKMTPQQHFTKPPTPYSEALLVKALEKFGVGRPSTYAQTLATLKRRDYVKVQKRKLHPTELGREVHQVLSSKLPGLFDVTFTAQMEAALDEIAAGQREGKVYLKDFWVQVSPLFGERVIQAVLTARPSSKRRKSAKSRQPRKPSRKKKDKATVVGKLGACPQCGKPLVKRKGKRGDFIGCSGFPDCRFTSQIS
jgi:DNA topoisomerase-1